MKRTIVGLALAGLAVSALAGEWGQAPNGEFWNGHSKRFIYAPALAFGAVDGAAKYSVEVTDDYHRTIRLETEMPTVSLEPVWAKLPVGYVTVSVRGVGACARRHGDADARGRWFHLHLVDAWRQPQRQPLPHVDQLPVVDGACAGQSRPGGNGEEE